jgi:hypothetical protein
MARCTRAELLIAFGLLITAAACIALYQFENRFSQRILWKGRAACHGRMPCVFTLEEVFGGGWDRMYVFDMAASQEEIDRAVGAHVRRPDLERLVVFANGNKILRVMSETQEFEKPDKLTFDRVPQVQNHIVIHPQDEFVLTRGDVDCDTCGSIEFIKPGQTFE